MKKYIIIILAAYAIFNPKIVMAPIAPEVMAAPIKVDNRITILKNFLEKYNSNLSSNTETFIKVADDNNLDYRLLPSIAGAESTFGKFTPSCASYNPFGWTSTTSPCSFWRFSSFDEAITTVGKKIGTSKTYSLYQRTGKITDLANTYNPGGADEWIKKINYFMEEIK